MPAEAKPPYATAEVVYSSQKMMHMNVPKRVTSGSEVSCDQSLS